jgi:voltage-gated potassium channel
MRLDGRSREEALHKFERMTAWPLLILAVAIIPIIVVPMVVDLPQGALSALKAADWLIWAAFAIDYIVRFSIAPRKGHFLTHHKLDLVVVAVPFAQPLRLIRSVRVLRVFRAGRAATYLGKGVQEGRSLLSRENFGFAILMAGLAILGGAALVYGLERSDPNGTIKSMPDAIWWAITTVSTVGSDKYPVTAEGRAIAVVLMVVGIGLVGLLAGTMASFFVEEQHKRQLAELLRKMEAIEMQLAKQNGPGLRSENGQTDNEDLAPVAPLGPSDRGR